MGFYFIDYENVHTDGFIGVEELDEGDSIILMYTEQCKGCSWDLLEKITKHNIGLEILKVDSGSKNALDFQLSSYLGYILAQNSDKDCKYYIVSKDCGYDRIVEFWNDRGNKITRVPNLSGKSEKKPAKVAVSKNLVQGTSKKKKNKSKKKTELTKSELLKYISSDEYSEEILEIVRTSTSKAELHKRLSQALHDTARCGILYKKVKCLVSEN